MKNTRKKNRSDDGWDSRALGASEAHVRRSPPKREKALDERLGLQTISIRLQKSLIDDLKLLAAEDGIRYQPYVRQILMRHARQLIQERRGKRKYGKHILSAR